MFNEYDVVVLKKPLPNATVPVSSAGTILIVHSPEDQAYEIEFVDKEHNTIDICTVVGDEYLELKWAYKETR